MSRIIKEVPEHTYFVVLTKTYPFMDTVRQEVHGPYATKGAARGRLTTLSRYFDLDTTQAFIAESPAGEWKRISN